VLSSHFSTNEYVIGFDPLNEPFPGNNFQHIDYNIIGRFDKLHLAPVFEKIFEKY
jgi:hypothetical protein